MSASRFAYPVTRYDPAPLVDLITRAARERLSPGALRGFFRIMARWHVRDEDARALLGGVSRGPYYELKRRPQRVLDADTLLRVSYLVGIFKALHVLHSVRRSPTSGYACRTRSASSTARRHSPTCCAEDFPACRPSGSCSMRAGVAADGCATAARDAGERAP